MDQEKAALLEGYRVLDLTDEKGHYCGKVLGDLGADVIKIEPPGGDPARNIGPFYQDVPHPEKSLNWFFMNLNKRGITLDITTPDGKALFKKLVKDADIVIESFAPGTMKCIGLTYEDLCVVKSDLIMTSLTPFGQTGPYAQYKVTDLIGVSMGGMSRIYGYFDSPPLRFSAPQFVYNGGIQAALGTVVALYQREMTGEGQYIDVSNQQAMLLTLMLVSEVWDIVKINYRGIGPFGMVTRPTPPGPLLVRWVWPCKDGYVYLMIGGGAALGVRISTERLFAWANSEGYSLDMKDADWLNVDAMAITQEEVNRCNDSIQPFLLSKTKEELFDYGIKHDLMLVPVTDMKDLVASPQLAARQFWVTVNHPELQEKLMYPGWPIKWTDLPPYQPQRRAPLIGEHNEEIYLKELNLSRDDLIMLKNRGVI